MSYSYSYSSSSYYSSSSVFKDQIYGYIEIPEKCMRIVNTTYFQRLRGLRQLGSSYYVFTGCSHNRFEHSIGVCYLAGYWIKFIKNIQPELNITEDDILAIQIAGLIHDIGHGPFSHLYDDLFIKKYNKEFSHEKMSIKIFDLILESLNKNNEFLSNDQIDMIKNAIIPINRINTKFFLYDFINNITNGIDVDKLDYFERDSINSGIKISINTSRIIHESRVTNINGKNIITYPIKLLNDIWSIYSTRMKLHQEIYQKIIIRAIDYMIIDAIELANKS